MYALVILVLTRASSPPSAVTDVMFGEPRRELSCALCLCSVILVEAVLVVVFCLGVFLFVFFCFAFDTDAWSLQLTFRRSAPGHPTPHTHQPHLFDGIHGHYRL